METVSFCICFKKMTEFKSYYVVWKLATNKQGTMFDMMFKSYYVVWKPSRGGQSRTRKQRLNRTMQYGNFKISPWIMRTSIWFKSYYVVWKLCVHCQSSKYIYQFKSYYVVWKHTNSYNTSYRMRCLNRTMQYGNYGVDAPERGRKGFKSYYVVWKLIRISYLFFPAKSLNRTMQYGNGISYVCNLWLQYQFKSYYVVWKPNAKGFISF